MADAMHAMSTSWPRAALTGFFASAPPKPTDRVVKPLRLKHEGELNRETTEATVRGKFVGTNILQGSSLEDGDIISSHLTEQVGLVPLRFVASLAGGRDGGIAPIPDWAAWVVRLGFRRQGKRVNQQEQNPCSVRVPGNANTCLQGRTFAGAVSHTCHAVAR